MTVITVGEALRLATRALMRMGSGRDEEGVAGDAGAGRNAAEDRSEGTAVSGAAARNEGERAAVNEATVRNEATARNEAEWLFQWVVGWSRTTLLVSMAEPLPATAWNPFWSAVERRVAGEPLQYIVGEAPFYGRWFHVEPGCLIPRPETEVLAEAAVGFVQSHTPSAVVVDVGTGSGALAVTIALECPQSDVWAVDLSADALRIAEGNSHQLGARVSFVHGDGIEWLRERRGWQDGLAGYERQADLEGAQQAEQAEQRCRPQVLVSNPPYIPSADIGSLDTDVRDHEPRLALDGGTDGLDFYRSLAALGQGVFAEGPAALFLEVGAGQAPLVRDLFTEGADFAGWSFELIRDLQGIERVVKGVRLG